MDRHTLDRILVEVEKVLHDLHQYQVQKAKKIAHKRRPGLSSEDLLNPDDFPEIVGDPSFMYEDGMAAGVLSAKIAVRAFLKEKMHEG